MWVWSPERYLTLTMGDKASEIPSDNAVPGGALPGIELNELLATVRGGV